MMHLIVTGGAGFIGSHIVDRLLGEGFRVDIIDNLATGRRENVHPDAVFHEIDIRSEGAARLIEESTPDAIIHLAAQMDVRKSVEDPLYDASVNIQGSLRLLEAARRVGVGRFLFASTGGAVYGEPERLPVTEDHPRRPLCPYAASKLAFEEYLLLYERLHGLPATILRLPNVYGPRQDPKGEAGVVAIFTNNLLRKEPCYIFGDGTKTRDYLYVEDVVDGFFAALTKNVSGTFNLGWGQEVTDRDVFETVRECVGSDASAILAPRRPGEIEHSCLSSDLARRCLSVAPKTPFPEGVAKAVAYYRSRLGAAS